MGKHRTSTDDETLRFFVTGTDTGVGKTEAACAVMSLLAEVGSCQAAAVYRSTAERGGQ